jgi:hypothetical protein
MSEISNIPYDIHLDFILDLRLNFFKLKGHQRLNIEQVLFVFETMENFFGSENGYYDKRIYIDWFQHGLIWKLESGRHVSGKDFEKFISVKSYEVPDEYIWYYHYHDYLHFKKEKDFEYAQIMLKLML